MLRTRVCAGTGLGNGFGAYTFELWFALLLVPAVLARNGPGTAIVMDNARFHRRNVLAAICQAAGLRLVWMPAYSPELGPHELLIGYVKMEATKQWLQAHQGAGVLAALRAIVANVPADHCNRWFQHCGWPCFLR